MEVSLSKIFDHIVAPVPERTTVLLVSTEHWKLINHDHALVLSADELNRASKYTLDEDRRRFILGRYFLRLSLSKMLNISPSAVQLLYSSDGKPYAQNSPYQFNISHSGELIALSFSTSGAIGIDVEALRTLGSDTPSLWEEICKGNEVLKRQCLSFSDEALLTAWVRHEALMKAKGTGLSHQSDLDSHELIKLGADNEFRHSTNLKVRSWWICDLPIEHPHLGAIASSYQDSSHFLIFALDEHIQTKSISRL